MYSPVEDFSFLAFQLLNSGFCLGLSRVPRLSGCFAGYIALPSAQCSRAIERHLATARQSRPFLAYLGNFIATLPRVLIRP